MKHTPVTDDQYFTLLSPQGLQLADQTLQQDHEQLRVNDLPVKDTVFGLLIVQRLRAEVAS